MFLARRAYEGRTEAIVILQAGIRKVLAQKKYNRMRIEVGPHYYLFITTDLPLSYL